jgi:hypothetical protein
VDAQQLTAAIRNSSVVRRVMQDYVVTLAQATNSKLWGIGAWEGQHGV